ncbi:HAD family hydrolase [Paenibacillus guangzhouensis]|uniref:HAD family hydrolase n=1 Tax=Paenibacillus guangzhouensis TaxID=1473112 RepID=UPI0012670799|nr:HAD family hydrolase [Paenibacillus guangzhouensis]
MLQKPAAMIFDLDGTLFQTETIVIEAFHLTYAKLREENLYHGDVPADQDILGCLGMLLEHIWERLMPKASLEVRERANELMHEYENALMERGQGKLYPGVAETLQALRDQGIRLFVGSNGLEGYVKDVTRHMGIDHLFERLYSAGEFQTATKVDLIRILLENHQVPTAWMVGDRSSDIEAGKKNQITAIGCDYAGFRKSGELEGADAIITSFDELLHLIRS